MREGIMEKGGGDEILSASVKERRSERNRGEKLVENTQSTNGLGKGNDEWKWGGKNEERQKSEAVLSVSIEGWKKKKEREGKDWYIWGIKIEKGKLSEGTIIDERETWWVCVRERKSRNRGRGKGGALLLFWCRGSPLLKGCGGEEGGE